MKQLQWYKSEFKSLMSDIVLVGVDQIGKVPMDQQYNKGINHFNVCCISSSA